MSCTCRSWSSSYRAWATANTRPSATSSPPSFAQLPGLVAKGWIDAESNRAGGVYTWGDRGACEAYLVGELFAATRAEPTLAHLRSRQFDVLERSTDITRGLTVPAAA